MCSNCASRSGWLAALAGLAVGLQAEAQAAQQPADQLLAGGEAPLGQRAGKMALALADPQQGRFRIAADRRLHQRLESLGFAQNFLSSCELEALHFIGIGSFGEEFREDVVFRGIQEQFRKPLA